MATRCFRTLLYGLIFLWCSCLPVVAKEYTLQEIPNVHLSNRNQYVSNPDGILNSQSVAGINQLLQTVADSLGIEVAVVAVESIGQEEPRTFANELFKLWGLGKQGKDNGLLLLLVTEPNNRSITFETGYGLESVLPDAICFRLQQRYMVPDMKEGDYSLGMLKGVAAVKEYLEASDYERDGLLGQTDDEDMALLWLFGAMALLFFGVIGLVIYLQMRPRVCPNCGQKSFYYQGTRTITRATYFSEGVVAKVYRCKKCGYTESHQQRTDRLHQDSVAVVDSVEDPGAEVPVEEVEPPAVFNSLFYSFTHSLII